MQHTAPTCTSSWTIRRQLCSYRAPQGAPANRPSWSSKTWPPAGPPEAPTFLGWTLGRSLSTGSQATPVSEAMRWLTNRPTWGPHIQGILIAPLPQSVLLEPDASLKRLCTAALRLTGQSMHHHLTGNWPSHWTPFPQSCPSPGHPWAAFWLPGLGMGILPTTTSALTMKTPSFPAPAGSARPPITSTTAPGEMLLPSTHGQGYLAGKSWEPKTALDSLMSGCSSPTSLPTYALTTNAGRAPAAPSSPWKKLSRGRKGKRKRKKNSLPIYISQTPPAWRCCGSTPKVSPHSARDLAPPRGNGGLGSIPKAGTPILPPNEQSPNEF